MNRAELRAFPYSVRSSARFVAARTLAQALRKAKRLRVAVGRSDAGDAILALGLAVPGTVEPLGAIVVGYAGGWDYSAVLPAHREMLAEVLKEAVEAIFRAQMPSEPLPQL